MDEQPYILDKTIEITPDMVEAGVRAASLYDSTDSLEMIVSDVFSAMLSAYKPQTRHLRREIPS